MISAFADCTFDASVRIVHLTHLRFIHQKYYSHVRSELSVRVRIIQVVLIPGIIDPLLFISAPPVYITIYTEPLLLYYNVGFSMNSIQFCPSDKILIIYHRYFIIIFFLLFHNLPIHASKNDCTNLNTAFFCLSCTISCSKIPPLFVITVTFLLLFRQIDDFYVLFIFFSA